MQNRRNPIVTLIVVFFTIAQILIVAAVGYTPYPDSEGYLLLAEEAIANGDFYPLPSKMRELAFLWNIGAINTAALSLKFSPTITLLLLVYSVMKGFTAWYLYCLTEKLLSPKAALITLLLYIAYPANYGESTSILSELPFIFFAIVSLSNIVSNKFLAAGVFLAIANCYRPMASVFILAVVIYLIADYYINHRPGIYRRVALFLAGFGLVISIIGTIEYHRTGRFYYQAATGWMALMQYSWDNDSDTLTDAALFEGGNPNVIKAETDVVEKDSIWQSHFFLWLKHNRGEYLRQMPRKLIYTYATDNTNFCAFLPDKNEREYMYEPLSMKTIIDAFPRLSAVQSLVCINLAYYYLILCLAVVGVVMITRRALHDLQAVESQTVAAILSVSVIVIGTAVLLVFGHGESRFHQPFMPFFFILAAMAISALQHRLITE